MTTGAVSLAEMLGYEDATYTLGVEQMMQRYAAVVGLPRRRIVRVPVLSPGLSGHWVQIGS